MDEIDKIERLKDALYAARAHLTQRTTPDQPAINELDNRITGLNRRLNALTAGIDIPPPTAALVEDLESDIQTFDDEIKQSKTASDVIAAITKLFSKAKA